MATKKCPKCGEENPAEAVMCWACYTPLAGGAAAVAGGGLVTPRGGAAAVTPAGTAAAQEEGKSAVDPKIFIVVGLLIGAAIIGSFTTGIIGGGGSSAASTAPDVTQVEGGTTGEMPPVIQPAPPQAPPQAPVFPPVQDTTGQTTVVPQTKVVVPPDPRQSVGTMGIVLNSPNITPRQALALAKFQKQSFEAGGKWKGMQVVVFNNQEAAATFRKYQAQRQGAPLTATQYQELAGQGLWDNVPAYYETRGKSEFPYMPSASPKNWWMGRR